MPVRQFCCLSGEAALRSRPASHGSPLANVPRNVRRMLSRDSHRTSMNTVSQCCFRGSCINSSTYRDDEKLATCTILHCVDGDECT